MNLAYFDIDLQATPFWKGNMMYNECIAFIEQEDGSKTATLLFAAVKIIAVYDNSLSIPLKEGVHYNMVPNPAAGRFSGSQNTFSASFETMEGKGVAFVDVNGLHQSILKEKHYYTTTGNCINHPND